MMINHFNEVTGRSGRSIAVAAEHPAPWTNVHDYSVVPDSDRFLWPILATLRAPQVAYHMSVVRSIDPDFPRNLSKTLTVDWSCISRPDMLHSVSTTNKQWRRLRWIGKSES